MKTIYIKLLRLLLIKFPHCWLADWGMFERHREQKAAPETEKKAYRRSAGFRRGKMEFFR